MTNGPPSTAASSSKSPLTNGGSKPHPQLPPFTASSSSGPVGPVQHPAANQPSWSTFPASPYATYSPASTYTPSTFYSTQVQNPPNSYYPNVHPNLSSAHTPYSQHYRYTPPTVPNIPPYIKPFVDAKKPPPVRTRPSTPPLPEPETYKHWDEAIKSFLVRTKFTQTLKGFEHDMLVLSPEWEQEVVPKALKEMVAGLQGILDRIAGKKKAEDEVMDTNPDVDILGTDVKSEQESSLDERKLGYISLANGSKPRTHSSINKSISKFLSQTRSRNDASNRSEFLHTVAEKRRKLQEAGVNPEDVQLSSCARVDAKPIDRDKQMQYDIAKNGEGPLIKMVKEDGQAPPSFPAQRNAELSAIADVKRPGAQSDKKRKFVDFVESQNDRKSKGKKKETDSDISLLADGPESDDDEAFETRIAADTQSSLNERLMNIEEHLAIRYVPSIPRTFLARLKNLEDHLIQLEKEYPPWAALHFNQPRRGWPAPPRATPIIVPPHLRSSSSSTPQNNAPVGSSSTLSTTTTTTTTSLSAAPSATTGPATVQTPSMPGHKMRKSNSTLHRAVLDRLEVQRAMSEMNTQREAQDGM